MSGPRLLVKRRTLQMEPDGWIGGLLQVNEIRNGSFSFLMVILILSMLILLILVFVASCKIYYCDVIVIVAFNDVLMLILVFFFSRYIVFKWGYLLCLSGISCHTFLGDPWLGPTMLATERRWGQRKFQLDIQIWYRERTRGSWMTSWNQFCHLWMWGTIIQ